MSVPSRLAVTLSIGAAFLAGMALSAVTCTTNPLPAGITEATGGVCTFPRGCYLVDKSGPNAGQCSDCTGGGERCRVYYVATPGVPGPMDLGGYFVPPSADLAGLDLGGTGLPDLGVGSPQLSDQPVLCTNFVDVPAGKEIVCATHETICVARGPRCTGGYCVHAGSTCATGTPIPPERRPSAGGGDTYCAYSDDVCCPPPADAGAGDASTDAGPPDAKLGD